MSPNKVNCLSLYAFQGDARQHQLSFPAYALIEIDPAQHPRNGWVYGTYFDTQFHKGWFPSSYVQYRPPTPPSTMPPLSEGKEEMGNAAGNRPRFTDAYNGSINNTSYSNRNQENQQHNIPDTQDESMSINTSFIYSQSYSRKDEGENDVQDNDVNDNGFDVATNGIMGGKIARANDDSDKDDDDDDDNEWGNSKASANQKEQSKRAFWGRFRLQGSKNNKKIKPVVAPKAKTPEWNAEPQIILPDGSIIQEYKTPKRGLFSHLSAAIQPPSS